VSASARRTIAKMSRLWMAGAARDGGHRAPANSCFQATFSGAGADCGYRAAADWLLNLSACSQATEMPDTGR
jgi:hypothetical protein